MSAKTRLDTPLELLDTGMAGNGHARIHEKVPQQTTLRRLMIPLLISAIGLAAGYGLGFVGRGDSGVASLQDELNAARIDTIDANEEALSAREDAASAEQQAADAQQEISVLESEISDLEAELEAVDREETTRGPASAGSATESTQAVPNVVGERLDVARLQVERAGYRVQVIGGGLFGVVVESNWTVCDQQPSAGSAAGKRVRLIVDRAGYC